MPQIDRRSLVAAAAAATALPLAAARAQPAPAGTDQIPGQIPGAMRTDVGAIRVSVLSDGYFDLGLDLMLGADPAAFARLKTAAFLPEGPSVRGGVNAFVVRSGARTVLIDAGGAALFGPSMGRLPAALAAAGVAPEAIDTVALTHMHPDHLGGLLAAGGGAAFPNAELAVHRDDWAFWTDPASAATIPEPMRFALDAAIAAVAPYADRARLLSDGDEVAPGLNLVALPGHTPGHSGYRVSNGDAQALIFGDVVHSALMQMAHPDWGVVFDADPAQAAATRARVLDMAAADRMLIAGMHVAFPAFGHVARVGEGYALVPMGWDYDPA